MKLFAVGVSDPNPDNWHVWDEPDLYSAKSKAQALKMARMPKSYPVVEVDMSKSRHILRAPEYIEDSPTIFND